MGGETYFRLIFKSTQLQDHDIHIFRFTNRGNPRRLSFWNVVLNKIRKRMSRRKGR